MRPYQQKEMARGEESSDSKKYEFVMFVFQNRRGTLSRACALLAA